MLFTITYYKLLLQTIKVKLKTIEISLIFQIIFFSSKTVVAHVIEVKIDQENHK